MMIFAYFALVALVSLVGINRRIGFWKTFLASILLTPFIGLIIGMNSGRLDAKGCKHCGNAYNEAEFCGICKKNEDGVTREEVLKEA